MNRKKKEKQKKETLKNKNIENNCRFDNDISSNAQASLAAEGWPSGK